uniref:Homeobox domain-containing protein n=1 Tax=Leersia perrieri TaxID=77586 RepID=A0A0D9V3W8_9ORYZ
MASSNRHWPSMFRSKHATQLPWQTQPDMAGSPPPLLSGSSTGSVGGGAYSLKSSPFSSVGEERVPDPKPRWNPRPEQIRILEAIFNSGMVNPPRDEIPRIRMQLQEYGQVGDANVFYWFQNRKSRSKNKLLRTPGSGGARAGTRGATATATSPRGVAPPFTPPPIMPQPVQQQLVMSPVAAPTSSSSSSSDRSSGSSKPVAKPPATSTRAMCSATAAMDLLSPLAAPCHRQMLYEGQPLDLPAPAPATKVPDEPIFLQWPQSPCLSAVDLGAAMIGAGNQHMHLPAAPVHQQPPPPSSPASGMFRGLCNDVTAPNKVCAWSAGIGQHWSSSGADQLGLGKTIAAVAREEAHPHDDATKLGLLQYGFGISTTPAVNVDVGSPDPGVLPPVPPSPSQDADVTVASVVAAAGMADFASSAMSTGAVANNQLQGLADFGLVSTGAGAGAAVSTGSTAVSAAAVLAFTSFGSAVGSFLYPATRFNLRHQFGDAAVLFRYKGDSTEAVRLDDSGFTVEPLQPGAVYLVLI